MAEADRSWYRDPPKLVAVVGTTVAAAIGLTQLVDKLIIGEPPTASVEYILDVSAGMGGKIGDKSKLSAVKAEILSHVRNTPSLSTALRLAGPSCSTEYRDPDVEFGEDNGDDFDEALQGVKAGGKSDFANTVSHAVSDFIGRQKGASGKTKTVHIFVAGSDTCSPRPVAVVGRALGDLRAKKDVEVNLKFVGIKLPPKMKRTLLAISKEAKKRGFPAPVEFVTRASELSGGGVPNSNNPPDPP